MLRYIIIFCLNAGALGGRKTIDIGSNDGKIMGGRVIDIKDAPYQAGIMYKNQQFCGGAIISDVFILTAAHCIYGKDRSLFSVRVGSNFPNSDGQTIPVEKVYMHSEYEPKTAVNDIALLKLKNSIHQNVNSKVIKIGTMPLPIGALITVTGWGTMGKNTEASSVLRGVKLPVVAHRECVDLMSIIRPVPKTAFCAGFKRGGMDTCKGDSGGPVTYQGKLIGLTSWGDGCGNPNSPGIYTRLSRYTDWINEISGITP